MKLNPNTKKIVIGAVVVIVVFLIAKAIMSKRGNTKETATAGTTATASGTANIVSSGTTAGCTNTTVLKKGSRCDRVQWSQYKINQVYGRLGISPLTEDGIFGSKTEAAFQKLLGKKTGTWTEVKSKADALKTFN